MSHFWNNQAFDRIFEKKNALNISKGGVSGSGKQAGAGRGAYLDGSWEN